MIGRLVRGASLTCAAVLLCTGFTVGIDAQAAGQKRYRLQVQGNFSSAGYEITSFTPGGPGSRLIHASTGQQAQFTVGDVVLSINGIRIQKAEDYFRALDASRDGRVRMQIRDYKTKQVEEWFAQAVLVEVTNPPPTEPKLRPTTGEVKFLLIGLTHDKTLSEAAETTVRKMALGIKGTPGYRDENVRILTGAQATAKNILRTIRELPVGRDDTLFVHYFGHGSYDPVRANGDSSGGHFLYIPSGDLMRKALLDTMKARQARLTVLLVDTCSTRAVFKPPPTYMQKPIIADNPVMASLLFKHAGVIDVSASSRDQMSWSDSLRGGWFSEAALDSFDPSLYAAQTFVSWDDYLARVSATTSHYYRERRGLSLENPGTISAEVLGQLRNQTDLRPQVFVKDLRRIP